MEVMEQRGKEGFMEFERDLKVGENTPWLCAVARANSGGGVSGQNLSTDFSFEKFLTSLPQGIKRKQ